MTTSQQPELRRSGHSTVAPDVPPPLGPDPERAEHEGPVPEANRPGHHPDHEQDKPDLDAVAERLGTRPLSATPDTAEHVTLPKPVEKVAYGVGIAIGIGSAVAGTAWHAGERLYERVRGPQ